MKSVMRVSKREAQGVNPNLVLKGEEAAGGRRRGRAGWG